MILCNEQEIAYKRGRIMILDQTLCKSSSQTNIKFQVPYEARVRDLIAIFDIITGLCNFPVAMNEEILDLLFERTKQLDLKLIAIAKMLVPFKIELDLTLIDRTQQVICEITNNRLSYKDKFLHVLHNISSGTEGLSRLITF